jgi:antitoxin PrlF
MHKQEIDGAFELLPGLRHRNDESYGRFQGVFVSKKCPPCVANIRSKGQITLPKLIRQMLGVHSGDKVSLDFDGKSVLVSRADPDAHTDPAIERFLAMIERDIEEGKNITSLPAALVKRLRQAKKRRVDLSEEIACETRDNSRRVPAIWRWQSLSHTCESV